MTQPINKLLKPKIPRALPQTLSLFSLIFIGTSILSDSIHASDFTALDSALASKAKAQNNYYSRMKSLGPHPSAAQEAQVRAETLNIANDKLSQVSVKAAAHIRSVAVKDNKNNEKYDSRDSYKSKNSPFSARGFTQTPSTFSDPSGTFPEPLGPALDGSQIPKELVFPGKKKTR